MSDINKNKSQRSRGRGRMLFWGIVFSVGVGLLSSFVFGRSQGHWRNAKGSYARHTSKDPQKEIKAGVQWMLSRVNATVEQRTKVNSILEKLAPEIDKYQSERQALQAQFLKAAEADEISRTELQDIQAKSLSLTEKTLNQSIDTLLKISEVLTPEQRKQLVESWGQQL